MCILLPKVRIIKHPPYIVIFIHAFLPTYNSCWWWGNYAKITRPQPRWRLLSCYFADFLHGLTGSMIIFPHAKIFLYTSFWTAVFKEWMNILVIQNLMIAWYFVLLQVKGCPMIVYEILSQPLMIVYAYNNGWISWGKEQKFTQRLTFNLTAFICLLTYLGVNDNLDWLEIFRVPLFKWST